MQIVRPHFIPDFETVRGASASAPQTPPPSILALDPGETVGWAHARDGGYAISGQLPKVTFAQIHSLINAFQPELLIMEKYVLYPWKSDEQGFSSFMTPRIIGVIEHCAWLKEPQIPIGWHGAGQGKNFNTDPKLKAWGFYQPGKPHANDATRHLCTYLLFGKELRLTTEPRPWKHDGETPRK